MKIGKQLPKRSGDRDFNCSLLENTFGVQDFGQGLLRDSLPASFCQVNVDESDGPILNSKMPMLAPGQSLAHLPTMASNGTCLALIGSVPTHFETIFGPHFSTSGTHIDSVSVPLSLWARCLLFKQVQKPWQKLRFSWAFRSIKHVYLKRNSHRYRPVNVWRQVPISKVRGRSPHRYRSSSWGHTEVVTEGYHTWHLCFAPVPADFVDNAKNILSEAFLQAAILDGQVECWRAYKSAERVIPRD